VSGSEVAGRNGGEVFRSGDEKPTLHRDLSLEDAKNKLVHWHKAVSHRGSPFRKTLLGGLGETIGETP
jgi:hypothetical protein